MSKIEEIGTCGCCTRKAETDHTINDKRYCWLCFQERRKELLEECIELVQTCEGLKDQFRPSKQPQYVSQVQKYGHYELVDAGNSCDPQFRYRIKGKGQEFGFTMSPIPVEHREWLAQVVRRQLYEAYEQGKKAQREEMRTSLDGVVKVLGLETVVPKLGK